MATWGVTPDLAGRIALVTGATGGIGARVARDLAAVGANVIVTDVQDEKGAALAKEIGGTYYRLDVTDSDQWRFVVEAIWSSHRQIDILVHCAGIEGDLTEIGLNASDENWNKVIAVNLTGSFYASRAVLPLMLKQRTGSVIFVSSIASYMATPSALAYGASKAGVQQLTRSVAMLGSRSGAKVRCNSVHPGVVRSRMTDTIIAALADAHSLSTAAAETMLVRGTPFARRGEVSEVSELIAFLASDRSQFITGAGFKIDGGWSLIDAG